MVSALYMWEMIYKGKLVGIEKHISKGFERAVRPPGVRLILQNGVGEFLLTKEFRSEQNKIDYRLPGGKVFDDLVSYLAVRTDAPVLEQAVLSAAALEAKQEVGVDEVTDLKILTKSVAGASVEWDLYYLTGVIKSMSEQELDGDEKQYGIDVAFYSKDEVLKLLRLGEISEDRTVGVLFRYFSPSSA